MTALNFPDSPSNGDTYQGYTYNGTKGTWAKPAEQDARTAVYANIAALPTSGTAGDMAYVTSTNRLYIWTGTGWYNIALINNNPTISGVSATYDLAIDGTATVITMTATDPEGLPITYSIASDTSGNIATVAQGTGANTNVFTITPSTNTAHAGTFSLTFRASDGVNIASAAASFTLVFNVQNQKYTTALITTAGNAGINNSFTDSSGNSHTVTASGDATQNSFSPYRHGGYAEHFTNDRISYANHSSMQIGTQDFCMEAWIKLRTQGANYERYITHQASWAQAGVKGVEFASQTTGDLKLHLMIDGSSATDFGYQHSIVKERWYHAVITRESGHARIFIDGVMKNNAANTTNINGANGTHFGTNTAGTDQMDDFFIRDFRLCIGGVPTDYSTTSTTNDATIFSVPDAHITKTSQGATASEVKALLFNAPYVQDASDNTNASLTFHSKGKNVPSSAYDSQQYSAGSHGGSVYLDGTGDRLSVGATTDLGFGTGDFTIEYWIKHESKLSGSNYPYAFDMRSQDNEAKLALYHRTNVNNIVGIYVSNNTIVSGTNQMYDGMDWVHYAVCKTGGYLKGYFNGKQDFSVADSTDYGSSGQISIGGTYSNLYHMQGHIADFRVVKGTAVYTAEFTPPTAPLTAITNTSLLLGMQGAKIFDKAQGNAGKLTLAGNTTASTAAYKYLPTSMYFDGTGDYIQLEGMDERYYGDFTVEMWVKFNTYASSGANSRIFVSRQGGNHPDNLQLIIGKPGEPAGSIDIWTNVYHINDGTTNVGDNNWHHVAVSRQGTSLKLFIDGTQEGSTATTSQSFLFWDTRIATRDNTTDATSKYTGYISDVRITRGLARYTSNFTPPTAALQG